MTSRTLTVAEIVHLATVVLFATPSHTVAQTMAETEVLMVVQRVFDGINAGDSTVLASAMHPTSTLVAIPERGAPRTTTRAEFLAQIHGSTGLFERMWDPEVHIDGRIAAVWTPYDFHIDGEFSHCGIDAFHLTHENGRWQVLTITYTRQTTGCPPSPLGPIP